MADITALLEEQKNLGKEMTSMLERAAAEGRGLTEDESTEHTRRGARYDEIEGLAQENDAQEARTAAAEARAEAFEIRSRGAGDDNLETERLADDADPAAAHKELHERAFNKYIRGGLIELDAEERAVMRTMYRAGEKRAQSVGTGSEGGFLVPEGFLNELTKTMLAFGGAREAGSRIWRTATGNPTMVPTQDDTTNTGALLAENTAASEVDVVVGQKQVDAYKYTSNMVRVSHEAMNDAAFAANEWVVQPLGERLGRITNTHHTVGTGTAQPEGFNVAAVTGETAASATAVTYAELVNLQHSVNRSYRALGATWTFADSTFAILRKLVDGDARPLWTPAGAGLAGTVPNTFLGDRYVINDDMPAMTTGLDPISYGAFSKFLIRDVGDVRMRRFDERYGEFDQVAFVGFFRTDSLLLDAAAIKNLTMA